MKLFLWNLDAKEKFVRTFWIGLFALIVLYAAVWYKDIHLAIPIIFTVVYLIDLWRMYKKIPPRNEHPSI
jgi:hypothetical protein